LDDVRRIADAVIAGLILRLIESAIKKLSEPRYRPKHMREGQ